MNVIDQLKQSWKLKRRSIKRPSATRLGGFEHLEPRQMLTASGMLDWAGPESEVSAAPVLSVQGQPFIYAEAAPRVEPIFGTDGDDNITVRLGETTIEVEKNGVLSSFSADGLGVIVLVGLGGNDTLTIVGTSADETATLRPGEISYKSPTDLSVIGSGFENITFDGGEGVDEVLQYDSIGDDTFAARPTHSYMRGFGFENRTRNVERVIAYSTSGEDIAHSHDSAGDDRYGARPDNSYLTGDDFYISVRDFSKTYAYSTQGGEDVAVLFGTEGDDTFVGKSNYGYLTGEGYHLAAIGFGKVYAHAGEGGTDAAYQFDSTEEDLYVSNANYSYMTGEGFHNNAIGFSEVRAFQTTGSRFRTIIRDTMSTDAITGEGKYFTIKRDGLTQTLVNPTRVEVDAPAEGLPEIDLQATDYFFEEVGDWRSANQTVRDFEAILTDGTWYQTLEEVSFINSYAFTFNANHSVAGRTRQDQVPPPGPFVRRWQVSETETPGQFNFSVIVSGHSSTENQIAFSRLGSGEVVIQYDVDTNSIMLLGESIVSTQTTFKHATGDVYGGWTPDEA